MAVRILYKTISIIKHRRRHAQCPVKWRAIVADAESLILDEPTSALDLKNQILILDWIALLSHDHGLTVLLTTHHPHHALAVADDVLLMPGQTEFVCGRAEDVLSEKNLRALYGVDLKRITFEHGGRNIQTLVPVIPPHEAETNGRS